ncbi:MAG: hypothetical protein ACK4R0_06610 [Blastomonas sp.]
MRSDKSKRMPDINQLFDDLHVAHMRALHSPSANERDAQRNLACVEERRVHAIAYPQPGSFMPG